MLGTVPAVDRRTFLRAGTGSAVLGVAAGSGMAVAQALQPDPEEQEFACTGGGTCEVVWSVPTDARAVAVTFDDGPHPTLTPLVLDVLADRGVRATFFLIGQQAEAHPDIVRQILDRGHELGNHTWSHATVVKATGAQVRREVLRGAEAVERLAGERPRWFRSPRGMLNGSVLRAAADLGQDVAMWSAQPDAGLLHDPAAATGQLVDALEPGAVYLFHDGTSGRTDRRLERRRHRERPVLERFLGVVEDQGFETVTLSELVATRSAAI